MSKKVEVKIPDDDPVPVEVIAQAIIDIGDTMRRLDASRLKQEAIVVLIADYSKVPKTTVKLVLNNLRALESIWLKP